MLKSFQGKKTMKFPKLYFFIFLASILFSYNYLFANISPNVTINMNCDFLNTSPNHLLITSENLYWDDKYGAQEAIGSFYGKEFHGRKTSNGEVFDMYGFTAAHRHLPFGTIVKVTNISQGKNFGKFIFCRINDRGPWIRGRNIDLSAYAAKLIGGSELYKSRIEIVKF